MSQYDPNILPVPDFVLEGLQPDPSSPRTDFDNFVREATEGEGYTNDREDSLARALGEYFERYNVAKDVRETTNAFVLGLQGMERNLFELGLRQVMDQIETGAENIDNPLLGGFIGGLGYLENYAPSVYDYFNDMFGENKTLDRSEILTNFGIAEDPFTPEEGDTFTFDQLVDRYNDAPAAQEYGLSVTYDPETNTFVEDVSGFGFEGDAATNTYTPEEFMERLGVEGSFEETQVETEVARPEGTVNLAELSEEQVGTFWPEIQQSLESLGGAVKQAVFGPGGVPKTPDELLEAIETGVMEGLKGPIAVTFDPEVGVTLDLKIPVGFEINGTSLQLPVFNEDGQFVLGQSIETAINQAGELITATGDKIGDIFTDGQGNIVLDVIDAGQVVLEGLGVTESGNIIGTLAENAIGDFIFNQNTGQPELTEEVDITTDDTTDDDTTVDRGDDVVNRDDPKVIPLTGPDDPEELTEEPIKPPKGSQYIDDKAGNIVGAIGPDGTVYNVDENGEWSVSTSDVVTEGGTTVLPGQTTIGDGTDDGQPPLSGGGDDGGDGGGDNGNEGLVTQPDGGLDEDYDTGPTTTTNGGDNGGDGGGDGGGDNGGNGQPPLDGGGDNGGNGQPPLDGGGGDVNDGQTPEEPPLVGPAGPTGPTGATGAAGAAGAPGSRGGYMGGLSYQLPQFVGVQYQPKDYTVELDRIINESLFKGMI